MARKPVSPGTEIGSGVKLNLVNIRNEVYGLLRERILNHVYPPGFRFDLSLLEAQLGISRTPLKEALHRLEAEKLIEIRPRRGTFVVNVNSQHVTESFEIRRVLESYAAEIAVREATEAEIAELQTIATKMSRLLERDDYQAIVEQYIELDHRFHELLVSLARNQRLSEICQQINTHVQIARVRQKFVRADSKQYTETEHEAILQALKNRDAPALVKALDEHIQLSKARTLKAMDGHE